MRIGIPRERASDERRVGLTPHAVRILVDAGHDVFVETGAGDGAGYADETYREAGGQIVYGASEVYGRSEIVTKIGPLDAEEMELVTGDDQIVFAFDHAVSRPTEVLEKIREHRLTLIGYEWIEELDGTHPVRNLMSEIAGSIAVLKGVQLMMSDCGGLGLAPGFVWGVPPATFVVLGCGVAGSQAVRTAVGIGANVLALDRDFNRLRRLDQLHAGRVVTSLVDRHRLERAVRSADVLILAISESVEDRPVTREMVSHMRARSVLVDMVVAMGGASETTRPTTPDDPVYVDEGVTHLCVPNLASLVSRSASRALSNVLVGYLLDGGLGGAAALVEVPSLRRGTVWRGGTCVHPDMADQLSRRLSLQVADREARTHDLAGEEQSS